jgi:hypothetical protein
VLKQARVYALLLLVIGYSSSLRAGVTPPDCTVYTKTEQVNVENQIKAIQQSQKYLSDPGLFEQELISLRFKSELLKNDIKFLTEKRIDVDSKLKIRREKWVYLIKPTSTGSPLNQLANSIYNRFDTLIEFVLYDKPIQSDPAGEYLKNKKIIQIKIKLLEQQRIYGVGRKMFFSLLHELGHLYTFNNGQTFGNFGTIYLEQNILEFVLGQTYMTTNLNEYLKNGFCLDELQQWTRTCSLNACSFYEFEFSKNILFSLNTALTSVMNSVDIDQAKIFPQAFIAQYSLYQPRIREIIAELADDFTEDRFFNNQNRDRRLLQDLNLLYKKMLNQTNPTLPDKMDEIRLKIINFLR